ncbi:MAG: flagellar assembly protein FliX [Aliidongia sp.]
MKVEANRSVGTSGIRKDGKTRSAGGFADNLRTEEEPPVSGVTATPVLSGIEALMALQEVPDAMARRKRAVARGDRLLDRLDDLRRGLLLGHISADKLSDLARMAAESSAEVDDPSLRDVLQEIELRARVELAKLSNTES